MTIFLIVLVSIFSGIVAGMGMGGGTVLIPLLTLVCGVSQKLSQSVNLLVFIPLAIVVLIIYCRRKLVNFKGVWFIIIPGIIVSLIGSIFSLKIESQTLHLIFGIFLICVGLFLFIKQIVLHKLNIKNKNKLN
ncbi:MAG: sulfite exporter TauE/SafE family protein [Clostridia bacterium]|nr:sulfite exporter TauE/SafE family protein [Clostridia bacterium]